jgi:hypothetical protein
MLVSLIPSLETYKVETIWPVIVVDVWPYKLLVPLLLQSSGVKKTF